MERKYGEPIVAASEPLKTATGLEPGTRKFC